MPQTTKGPVGEGDKTPGPAPATDSTDQDVQRALNMDDETWSRVLQQASSTAKSPAEVISTTIRNALGGDRPVGAWHSGQATDPSIQATEPAEN